MSWIEKLSKLKDIIEQIEQLSKSDNPDRTKIKELLDVLIYETQMLVDEVSTVV